MKRLVIICFVFVVLFIGCTSNNNNSNNETIQFEDSTQESWLFKYWESLMDDDDNLDSFLEKTYEPE